MSTCEPSSGRPEWAVSFDDDNPTVDDNGTSVIVLALSQEEIDLLEQALDGIDPCPLEAQLRTRLQLARIDLVDRTR